MSCPSCGRQPNRFVNGLLMCEGGHEWPGQIVNASQAFAPGVQPVPVTIRGVEYPITPSADKNYMFLVALIMLNHPDVDTLLKAFGIVLDVGGRRVFPPESVL